MEQRHASLMRRLRSEASPRLRSTIESSSDINLPGGSSRRNTLPSLGDLRGKRILDGAAARARTRCYSPSSAPG